jgi:hypothetical protein
LERATQVVNNLAGDFDYGNTDAAKAIILRSGGVALLKGARQIIKKPTKEPDASKRLCSLFDLDDTRCRFPIGDTTRLQFCGGETMPGSSYCLHHYKIAYIKRGRYDV